MPRLPRCISPICPLEIVVTCQNERCWRGTRHALQVLARLQAVAGQALATSADGLAKSTVDRSERIRSASETGCRPPDRF